MEGNNESYKDTFSIRASKDTIDKFKSQSKAEGMDRGEFFDKIINIYMGYPLSKITMPFKITLFWIDNINTPKHYKDKKSYLGLGVPTYLSEAFTYYKRKFYGDNMVDRWKSVNENGEINWSQLYVPKYNDFLDYQCTEMLLSIPIRLEWYDFKDLTKSEEGIARFKKNFGIKNQNLKDYKYMSAFRVFKEPKINDKERFIVNEHMYLINNEKYEKFKFLSNEKEIKEMIMSFHEKAENDDSKYKDICVYADEMDLAVSTIYEVLDVSKAEEQLALDREYLTSRDVSNLKNLFQKTITKESNDLQNVLSEYKIK